MADDKEQRTEEATEKRRQETREKGRTAQSREVSSTFVLLASILLIYNYGGYIRENIVNIMTTGFTMSTTYHLDTTSVQPIMIYYLKMLFTTLAPVMLGIAAAGIIANVLQNGGFILSLEPLKPKFTKLDPIKGFGRFVSKQALVELLKSLSKVAIVGYICYWVVSGEWENIPALSDQGPEQIIWFISWVGIKLAIYVLLLMIVLSVADYAFQRYSFEEDLKMTKQEVKDERKQQEGDPIVKQRIRSAQMAIARRRMMAEVPKAEVVITNPTHLAIAIAYNRHSMAAPTVVAKGQGHIAKKIREIAKENDIPIIEDKPLARILFKTVNIGHSIPEELYRAIAEILAYVYKLKGKAL